MLVKLTFVLQMALFAQPDAKIANGIYWAEFWLNLVGKFIN